MEPDYEETIRRIGSDISNPAQSSATVSQTISTNHPLFSKANMKYIYASFPAVVLIGLFVWSPKFLHESQTYNNEFANPENPEPKPKLNKVRLLLATSAISGALIAGFYMYNMKRKTA
jgi:hypothetical protein